jgi:predicted metal-binding protein
MIHTKLQVLGQIAFCQGCCCGKTERGIPAVPVDRIKAVWKKEKLNRTIHLTVAGCLGPCDVPNVAAIVVPSGQEWFGNLGTDADYDALIEWARACHKAGEIVTRPAVLESRRFQRFTDEQAISAARCSSSADCSVAAISGLDRQCLLST